MQVTQAVSRRAVARSAGKLCALAALVCLSACGRAELEPAGPVSAAERTVLFDSLAIMLAIVIPVIVATLLIAFRFRASNPAAAYRPTFTHSGRIELIIWSIPALVIFFLGGMAWTSSFPSRSGAARCPRAPSRSRSRSSRSTGSGSSSIPTRASPASIGWWYRPACPLHLRLTSASRLERRSGCRSSAACSIACTAWPERSICKPIGPVSIRDAPP